MLSYRQLDDLSVTAANEVKLQTIYTLRQPFPSVVVMASYPTLPVPLLRYGHTNPVIPTLSVILTLTVTPTLTLLTLLNPINLQRNSKTTNAYLYLTKHTTRSQYGPGSTTGFPVLYTLRLQALLILRVLLYSNYNYHYFVRIHVYYINKTIFTFSSL